MTTAPRLNLARAGQKALAPMYALEEHFRACSLERSLIELVKIRASQINGCAFCLHMHTADALSEGEAPARIFLLDAWPESHLYSARERAALAWTEALTRIADTHAPDEAFAEVRAQFDDAELMDLSLLIATINSWNRLAIGFRSEHPNDLKAAA